MRMDTGCATDPGMIRETNQDRVLIAPGVLVVADGMGGHAGGELAAETAVEEIRHFPRLRDADDLVDAIRSANRAVLDAADRTGMSSMGTTVVAALLRPDRRSVTIANVGDSRAYYFHAGELDQITRDHSLVEDLLRAGKISEDEARDHPHKNVVTRVLGIGEDPDVDIFELAVRHQDLFLLASDGLFNEVAHSEIVAVLSDAEDLDLTAHELVRAANRNGGNDNISVVLARVLDDAPEVAPPQSASSIAQSSEPTVEPIDVGVGAALEPGSGKGTDRLDLEDAIVDESPPQDTSDGDVTEQATEELPMVGLPPVRRSSRLRAVVFAFCVLALLALGAGGLVAYGRNAWFIQPSANEVVIYRGRPGGVLFIEPQAVEPTGINVNDLNPASRNDVEDQPVFGSLADARAFVDQLELSTVRTSE